MARITLTDEATFSSRATLTNKDGEYVFNTLNPATYSVTAEAPGFKRFERKSVLDVKSPGADFAKAMAKEKHEKVGHCSRHVRERFCSRKFSDSGAGFNL